MLVYVINFIINMAVGFLLVRNRRGIYACDFSCREEKRKRRRVKLYLLFTTVQLGLLCGFRGLSVGYDTANYLEMFRFAPDSFETLFQKSYLETGFSIVCELVKICGGGYHHFLVLCALFIVGSACVFIYRHSKSPLLSVFLIICFPFYYTSFDILRHFLATAFFLLGYRYILEKKFFRYLLFIVLGSLFHSVAWVFLPLYFMRYFKWDGRTRLVVMIIAGLCFVFMTPLITFAGYLLGKPGIGANGWIGEFSGGIKTAVMYGVLFFMCVTAYYNKRIRTNLDDMSLNNVMLLFIGSIFFLNARIMIRLIVSCIPLYAIAVPQLLDGDVKDKKVKRWLEIGFLFTGVLYHAFMLITSWQNVVPYVPFWGA